MGSPYSGSCIILTTKHGKSVAIAPPFWAKLSVGVLEYLVDTDVLGTFSGEVARAGSALACVQRKCAWGVEQLGVEYGLASEGSFGPHPFIPFLPCDHEILYFIDRKRNFHLHLSHISEKTNYQMQVLASMAELQQFAKAAQFPSHALILRPNHRQNKHLLFKGIQTADALEAAFKEAQKHSPNGTVWVETDMRAHLNPSRMSVIGELAEKMAQRLATPCPKCQTPGWGEVRVETGLACRWCGSETELVKAEIFGCTKCDYEVRVGRADGLREADPGNCPYCNP